MYALNDPLLWVSFVYFFAASFIAFYIPGNLFIRKLKLDALTEILLSIVTGFVLWTLTGLIFGFLNTRNLMYLSLIALAVIWIKSKGYLSLKKIRFSRTDIGIGAVILLGTLVQLTSIWLNGVWLNGSVYFCCGIPDTITHLSLTAELIRRFPPNEPGFSGVALTNYHYLSNLGVADFIRIFGLPLVATQYQYMTVLFSVLLGASAVALARALSLGRRFVFWLVFFLYFSGDIIFLLPVLAGRGINFSVTTLENASSLWISPPRFYALVILLSGLTLFVHWLKKRDMFSGIMTAIVLGSIIGFKVYVGLFVLSGFAIVFLLSLFRKKISTLIPIAVLFGLSGALYALVTKDAGGLLFTGFWRFEDFIVQPSLGLSHLELARRVFLEHSNTLRALLYDLLFGFLYIFFSAGTLLLGSLQTKKSLNKIPKEFIIVLIAGLVITCSSGFFFLQQTGGANTSQFLISIYVVGSFFAALAVSRWTSKLPSPIVPVLATVIVLATSARVVYSTYLQIQRITQHVGASVPGATVNAYTYFLTTKKDSVVMVYNDATLDCLFITFIGERPTYSCTIGLPGVISELVMKTRNEIKNTVFFGSDLSRANAELRSNSISYIYIPTNAVPATNVEKLNVQRVYNEGVISIYRVLQ